MKIPILVATATILLSSCVPEQEPSVASKPDTGGKAGSTAGKSAPKPGGAPVAAPGTTPDKGKPAAEAVAHVDAAGAAKLIAAESGVVVLDVRTPSEFAAGHLKGAVNIDFRGPEFAKQLSGLDKSKKYLVHCQSGGRSTSALATFAELGFAHVVHMDGGMRGWVQAGQPVEK